MLAGEADGTGSGSINGSGPSLHIKDEPSRQQQVHSPSVEACALCAVPKASLTKISAFAANWHMFAAHMRISPSLSVYRSAAW